MQWTTTQNPFPFLVVVLKAMHFIYVATANNSYHFFLFGENVRQFGGLRFLIFGDRCLRPMRYGGTRVVVVSQQSSLL